MLISSEVAARCDMLGGVARTGELIAAGASKHAIAVAVRERMIERVREGVYCLPGTSQASRSALVHGGMVSCISAAEAAGLWVIEHHGTHVAVARQSRLHPHDGCACTVHRPNGPAPLGRRSPVSRALVEILGCLGDEAFFIALESAMRLRKIDAAGLARVRRRMPLGKRSLVDFARGDADSGLESLLRFRLRRYGLDVAAQVDIPGVGRVDFVIGDRLVIEVDGRQNHEGSPRRHRDLERDAVAAGLGFDTLRFDYALVVHDWTTVLGAILAKVDAELHRTQSPVRFL
ncbi:DUF559 domain-containing protein [Agromyces sp. NPDC058126]|uniref:DUF559 domain-containing protein n=1 Tax=Agromyces sp. NPDC058126 TaxID=3346350 RepID=UPI0036DAA214